MERLDRKAFKHQSLKEADNTLEYWLSRTPAERLEAAWILTCRAYGLDPYAENRLDRTVFSMKKRGNDAQKSIQP
jgi:hypothetical protein